MIPLAGKMAGRLASRRGCARLFGGGGIARDAAKEGAVDWSKVRWGDCARTLLEAAEGISKVLGHYGVVCPLHLLLGILISARPSWLVVAVPDWDRVRGVMHEVAPPWEEGLAGLSPGAQPPTTKRVLSRAIELASEAGEAVEVQHVWAALSAVEADLVQAVLARLGTASKANGAEQVVAPGAGRER